MKFSQIVFAFTISLFFCIGTTKSQTTIDQVIAVVGGERILLSDIEQELMRMKMQGSIHLIGLSLP
jgi:hypothetical protein